MTRAGRVANARVGRIETKHERPTAAWSRYVRLGELLDRRLLLPWVAGESRVVPSLRRGNQLGQLSSIGHREERVRTWREGHTTGAAVDLALHENAAMLVEQEHPPVG